MRRREWIITALVIGWCGGVGVTGCGHDSSASGGRDRDSSVAALELRCTAGELRPGEARTATLGISSCTAAGGLRYADHEVRLAGARGYTVVVTAHPGSDRHGVPWFDVALFTAEGEPRLLLAGSTYRRRDPAGMLSELLFVAPDTARYAIRVQGHRREDRGTYAISVRACGGGRLDTRLAAHGVLSPASCVMRTGFGSDSGYVDLWTLHLDPRQSVAIRATSANGIPLSLRIRGPELSDREVDADVDRLRFTARSGGEYTVLVAQPAAGRRTTRYSIRVDRSR
jgi:hypothetical protein